MDEEYLEGCNCVNCRLIKIEKQIDALEKRLLQTLNTEKEKEKI